MQEQSPPRLASIRWSDVRPHLEAEVTAAANLHSLVDSLSRSIAKGDPAPTIEDGVVRQEQALRAARDAVERRRQRIGELGSLEARMKDAPAPDREELRTLLERGTRLRSEIEERVQRTSFVARKTAAWCEGHRTFLVDQVLRQKENGLYSAPGAANPGAKPPSVSASLDRSV